MISELVRGISSLVIRKDEKIRNGEMKKISSFRFGRVMHNLTQNKVITEEEVLERIGRAKNWIDPDQAMNGYFKGIMLHREEMGKLVPSSKHIEPALEAIPSLTSINPQT